MAFIESALALSHVEGVSDSARARELYKYYQPNASSKQDTRFPLTATSATAPSDEPLGDDGSRDVNIHSNVSSSKISSPDTALTAFCQLVSWRIGAQRAMISLIDADTQYFIAESTKTVDLINNKIHEPGDEIWMGCSSVSKAGRLCERTIAAAPTKVGEYPCFIVNDLRQDDRFNELPFVTGSPYLKFYAGVPLVTKRGIPIGSLFIVDDRVWSGLSKANILFMGTMAGTIMKHLEMVREVEAHRRGMKMSRGLASFVEGRAELVEAEAEAEAEAEDPEGIKIAGHFDTEHSITRTESKASQQESSELGVRSDASNENREQQYSAALAKTEEAIMETNNPEESGSRPDASPQPYSFGGTSVSVSSPQEALGNVKVAHDDEMSEGPALKTLFSRAANLIREAFEVDGGVVFYDTQRGFGSQPQRIETHSPIGEESYPDSSHASGDDHPSVGEQDYFIIDSTDTDTKPSLVMPGRTTTGFSEGMFSRSSTESINLVDVLGFSTAEASSIRGDDMPGRQAFKPFHEKALTALLKRYPRGKLWTFNSDGAVSSSSEEEGLKSSTRDSQTARDRHRRNARSAKTLSDARFLSAHFPGVRQLLFVPLWDAGRSRWLSGCFAWSTEPTRVLSKQGELAFLSAFGNSVMAECSRLDTEIADQKKGDFIGSISHELRSPLHGILASAEFLSEEDLSTFEKGLVETIDSCGRTLLDTINHILDFSKINQFEKTWRKSKRGGPRSSPYSDGGLSLRKSNLPMVNLFAEVDISVICEEVVEGVFAGHVFQNLTAGSFDIVPPPRGKMSDPSQFSLSSEQQLQHSQVQVIYDVDLQSYNFITQPGAFRRVIMNIIGNALKYTSHGYVLMKLEATPMEALHTQSTGELTPRSLITVTIRDTGRGITSEFLRSKVFTPFTQENSLSSGTGLGLSIVRSIVTLLEGEITIDSEVGRGTEIRLTLPLLHDMPKTTGSSSSNPKSIASSPRENDEAINKLRARVIGRKVALHGFEIDSPDPVICEMYRLLKVSVTNFLTNWYGLQVVPLGTQTNIIISNEADPATISNLARQAASIHRNKPAILVLCSQTARFDRNISPSDTKCKIGFVAKPVGPLKLAKALSLCLEGGPPLVTPGLISSPTGPIPPVSNDLSNVFEELSISSLGGELLDNSRMATDSKNARKAIESPTPNGLSEKHEEFPFPVLEERPQAHSMPGSKDGLAPVAGDNFAPASLILASMEKSALLGPTSNQDRRYAPSLLLVDDNKINLRLLTTYMRKNKYPIVDEADNGLEAVNKFQDRAGGYDIVFMDISMPILDGFGATKQIRAIENSRRTEVAAKSATLDSLSTGSTDGPGFSSIASEHNQQNGKNSALIIALTGLASGRDQQQAASVGIDIFLTKPVSFKEVGKLLENWEANRERDARDGL